jgi:aryl-alcohol dehydrogenase-like predicted oxidoreductase
MKMRTLGKNGPELSVIGLGAWAIGGPWLYGWGPVDDDESIRAIHEAIELGINWIDTAAVYGLGHSEEVVGRALSGMRERVFIATKCGLVWDEGGNVANNLRPESIRKEVEASLRRLRMDVIDLYQFHWPDPATPVEESCETMVRLQEEGKIRYLGVSNFDVSLLQACETRAHVQSLQPPYSLLNRRVETDILPFCAQHDVGVIAYSPMQSGLLSGAFDMTKLAPDDWRRKYEWFQEPRLPRALSFVETLRPLAAEYGMTVGQLAIAWVLAHRAVTSAIVGGRTRAQVREFVRASEMIFSKEHYDQLTRLSDEVVR